MSIDPKVVQGRRTLSFSNLDDVVQDAEALVASPAARTIGNWPLDRLLSHLAMTVNSSLDGFTMQAPWFVRLLGPLLKKSALKKLSPGIRLPSATVDVAFPPAGSAENALQQLKDAVERTQSETMKAAHPAFGKMTHDEWIQLHLRHSEMHLSFALPD